MKFTKMFAVIALILFVMPVLASAQSSRGILDGMESDILTTVVNVLNFPVPIFSASLYNAEYVSKTGESSNAIPLWLVLAMFSIVYAVIWIASGFVKIFKDDSNRSARIVFSIAVSLITIFATPIMFKILSLVKLFSSLAILAILVLGVFLIWVLFRSGWASGAATNAESKQSLAQAAQLSAEAGRQKNQAKEYERKTSMAMSKGIKNQRNAIKSLRSDLTGVLGDLQTIGRGRSYSRVGRNLENRVLKRVGKISQDLGKIITFTQENDRTMAGMRNADYELRTNVTLNRSNPDRVSLERTVASETNDLGRIISGISQEIKTNGIQSGAPPNNNVNKLISWTENAVNIALRMERDLVTEEQMIEKI